MQNKMNKKTDSFSTKLKIPLDPDMRAEDALRSALRTLLHIIQMKLSHIEYDLDTEIIHDFRVAVRRTRSALGQSKNVFSAKATIRFSKDFSFLGKLSNNVRDLDVFLLKEEAYRLKLPAILCDDIDPLFDRLKKEIEKAFKRFVHRLNTVRSRKIIRDWEAFLSHPTQRHSDASDASVPVFDFTRRIICKRYKDVLKAGIKILEKPDDIMLHALRIHCKKLRYSMELFSGLFPEQKIDKAIRILKKLQDNLGDYNDLSVQVKYLLDISTKFPLPKRAANKTILAIGSLIGALEKERTLSKDAFKDKFKEFSSEENGLLFDDLFSPKNQR